MELLVINKKDNAEIINKQSIGIDTSNVLANTTFTQGNNFTSEYDCWAMIYSNHTIYINGHLLNQFESTLVNFVRFLFPLKKGDVISSQSTDESKIKTYGIKYL